MFRFNRPNLADFLELRYKHFAVDHKIHRGFCCFADNVALLLNEFPPSVELAELKTPDFDAGVAFAFERFGHLFGFQGRGHQHPNPGISKALCDLVELVQRRFAALNPEGYFIGEIGRHQVGREILADQR